MSAKGEYVFAVPVMSASQQSSHLSFPFMMSKPDISVAARAIKQNSVSHLPSPIALNGLAAPVPRKMGKHNLNAPPTPPPSPTIPYRKSTTTFSVDSSDTSSSSHGRRKPAIERNNSKKRNRVSTSSIFDKNDERYRCCCGGLLHIRHGALIIGIVECLLALANMIAAVCLDAEYGQRAQPMRGVQTEAYLIISVLCMVLFVGTVGWMAYASVKRRKLRRCYLHLIPHLVVQMLTIMMLTSALIILAVLAFHTKNVKVAVDVLVLALLGVGMGIEVFFFALVLRCYHYLKDEYELSARAIPTCVVCPVKVEAPQVIMFQPNFTFQNVDANEYCVY